MQIKSKFYGHFKVQVFNEDGSLDKEAETPNVICNKGLDAVLGGTSVSSYVAWGTGTNTPAATDTDLQTRVAVTSTVLTNSSWSAASTTVTSAPYSASQSVAYTFASGNSGNLNEVGWFYSWSGSISSSYLFSHALISGGPISVASAQTVVITYTLTWVINNDITGTTTINGTGYNYTIRPYNLSTWHPLSMLYNGSGPNNCPVIYTSDIYPTLGTSSGLVSVSSSTPPTMSSSFTTSTYSNSTYTNGTFILTHNMTFTTPSNVSSFNTLVFATRPTSVGPSYNFWQIYWSTAIPLVTNQTITIPVSIQW